MRNFQDSFEARKPSFTSAISVCVSRDKKFSFFGKLGMLCFPETSVLRFALLPYYRQNEMHFSESYSEPCETPKIEKFFYIKQGIQILFYFQQKSIQILFYFLQEQGNLESFILKLPRFLVVIKYCYTCFYISFF